MGEREESWEDDALCAQVSAEFFFPKGRGSGDATQAKRICSMCSVRAECLEWATWATVTTSEGFEFYIQGVLGGKTEKERAAIRAKAQPALYGHGTRACYARGCRQSECVRANTEYQIERNRRERQRVA